MGQGLGPMARAKNTLAVNNQHNDMLTYSFPPYLIGRYVTVVLLEGDPRDLY